MKPTKILLVQKFNRAYRSSFLCQLSNNPSIDLTMVFGTNSPIQPLEVGINISNEEMPFKTIPGKIKRLRIFNKELLWFDEALKTLINKNYDVVISDYYTSLLSTFPMQSIQKIRNRYFILWGIGFHQYETPILNIIRRKTISRTDALLLYTDREKKKYINMGINPNKCFVINNTVDLEAIKVAAECTRYDLIEKTRSSISPNGGPILLHVGRLAKIKRLDFLLKAIPKLQEFFQNIQIVLIGDGPERLNLEKLSKDLNIYESVHFLGSIMDHNMLAPFFLSADLIVAPAQIGLLGPMAQAYSRAMVISNSDLHLAPEIQVFNNGTTGIQYQYGNVDSLIEAIVDLLNDGQKRERFGREGFRRVHEMTSYEQMIAGFLDAINYVIKNDNANS